MNRLLGCEKEFQLKHVHYVDLVVQWTVVNEPALTQDVVDMLWGAIRARELCYEYLKIVRDSTIFGPKTCFPGRLVMKVKVYGIGCI